jgi:hypothetical protein
MLDLKVCFKKIFNEELLQKNEWFASIYHQSHLLVLNGNHVKLLKCLKGAASEYLRRKAIELTKLIGLDLIIALNALWVNYLETTNFFRLCLRGLSSPIDDQVGNLLLSVFKCIIVMPGELLRGDCDFALKDRRHVHVIHIALRGAIGWLSRAYSSDKIVEPAMRTTIQMLDTLKARMFFEPRLHSWKEWKERNKFFGAGLCYM